jgi:hypothetical protein
MASSEIGAYAGVALFVGCSSALHVNTFINRVFNRILLGHAAYSEEREDADDDSDEGITTEEEQDVDKSTLRRNVSSFSLGLNRNASVDDLIRNFEWEMCSDGQRILHTVRIAGYATLALVISASLLVSQRRTQS